MQPEKADKIKSETLLMKINFFSVWLIVWIILTGLVKLKFMQDLSKWING